MQVSKFFKVHCLVILSEAKDPDAAGIAKYVRSSQYQRFWCPARKEEMYTEIVLLVAICITAVLAISQGKGMRFLRGVLRGPEGGADVFVVVSVEGKTLVYKNPIRRRFKMRHQNRVPVR